MAGSAFAFDRRNQRFGGGNSTSAENATRDDGQLVEAALRDRHAFALVVNRYEGVLGRYVSRLLGLHAQSAEDVLQDIFVKAYINLNDYDSSRPFSPWIYRIAHNEAISFLRKRRSEPQSVAGGDALLIFQRAIDGDDPFAAWQRVRIEGEVHKAMASLDQRYRDILILRYLEEKSYDDISDILKIPAGTVATQISRGLRKLKIILQAEWGTT